eukprot:14156826-Alexandrium_andersonii.AAC.1
MCIRDRHVGGGGPYRLRKGSVARRSAPAAAVQDAPAPRRKRAGKDGTCTWVEQELRDRAIGKERCPCLGGHELVLRVLVQLCNGQPTQSPYACAQHALFSRCPRGPL